MPVPIALFKASVATFTLSALSAAIEAKYHHHAR